MFALGKSLSDRRDTGIGKLVVTQRNDVEFSAVYESRNQSIRDICSLKSQKPEVRAVLQSLQVSVSDIGV